MADAIYCARLRSLAEAVAALPVTERTLMLLERVPMAWLEDEERINGLRLNLLDSTTDFDLWERGRIFSPAFELRWERADGFFQVVYCGQETALPGFNPAEELDLSVLTMKTRSYFLWGSRVKEEDLERIGQPYGTQVFIELKVPRLLHYPVSPQAQRVKFQVCEYEDASGTVAYYRFMGLEEVA